jgi:hypothetical protein
VKRFQDRGQKLYHFTYLFLVRCPRCDKCAEVVLKDKDPAIQEGTATARDAYLFAPRRLVCNHCGYVRDWEGNKVVSNDSNDWYFRQPLWLQVSCCGELLWALNEDHLGFLEELIGAHLRETYPRGTLANRLPAWMMSAKNREDVLKCIRKLRATLPSPNNRILPDK